MRRCFCFLLLVGLFSACANQYDRERNALARYARATLTPGTSLGDLQLGQTTLGWVVRSLGSGTPYVQVSDDTALELVYLSGELSLLFPVTGDCQRQTDAPRTRLNPGRDLKPFLETYPACNELKLRSLSVFVGTRKKEDRFYQGSTSQGVQLWMPITEMARHGEQVRRPGQLVPGESEEPPPLDRMEFPGGIYFYYPTGARPTAEELMSGRPLSPERLRELEASAKEATKDLTIKRMTIFLRSE
jgi:hypothetical protein